MIRHALRWFVIALAVSLFGAVEGSHLMASLNDPIPGVLEALHASADVAPTPAPAAAASAGAPVRRVVVVLIDGLGAGPFDARLREGTLGAVPWALTLDSGIPSRSRPVYHAILTGVPQWAAGIRSNAYATARADSVPDRVRAAGGTVAWMLASVPWFYELFGAAGDVLVQGDEATSPAAFARVWDAAPDLTVVHLIEVDDAGHLYGADSAAYVEASRRAMDTVAKFRAIARAKPGGDGAIWFVGADHGHTASGGHGGPERSVRRVEWVALYDESLDVGGAAGVPVAPPGAEVTSLAPTIARALGVGAPRGSMADGLPLLPTLLGAPLRARAARVEAVTAARAANASRALGAPPGRAILLALALVAMLSALALLRGRRGAAEALVLIATASGFFLAGPGLSMSAVRTEIWYLGHALGVLTVSAAIAWSAARRWASPMVTAAVCGVFPLLALVAMRGSLGRSDASPIETVLVPSFGLVPASVCAAIALVETWLALRLARRT